MTVAGATFTAGLYLVTDDDGDPNSGFGTLLASATYSSVTGNAWNQLTWASPILLTADTLYRTAVHSSNGRFVVTSNFFASDVVNGNLTAPASGSDPIGLGTLRNGTYRDSASLAYPKNHFNAGGYFVDLRFEAGNPIKGAAFMPFFQ